MRVKICGLCRAGDASMAAAAGADYVGVILAPGGARTQTIEAAAAILAAAEGASRVGVFVNDDLDRVVSAAQALELSVVQLHGDEDPDVAEAVRAAGSWKVWKAVRPRSGAEFARALDRIGAYVDGVLVDGFTANARGGTGTSFPWDEVGRYREKVPAGIEFIVAGGLTPDNVGRVIEHLRPDAVDVSSGVEAERCVKSEEKVRAFIDAARAVAAPAPEN